MSFGAVFALAIALLVAAPVAAHLLRRRRTEERLFPPAKLIPATAPTARRRSLLEDRFLFGVRALSVLVLAVLGASPFVSCSHLAIDRKGGASVAIVLVIDDSLSMREPLSPKQTKLARAMEGARQLVADAHEGDAVAIVSAGAPARLTLALTTDLRAASGALDGVRPSDRATDLDGAVALAEGLLKSAPQVDRRVVLLTDRADGKAGGPPLDTDPAISLWEPLPELAAKGEPDCAVISAERAAERVAVRITCTKDASPAGRTLTLRKGETAVKSLAIDAVGSATVSVELPKDAPTELVAELSPDDALRDDDRAPVTAAAPDVGIGVVADPAKNRLVTGGPPPVEQAFAALDLAGAMRPLTNIPEHPVDLKELAGLVLDDPPGLTPEQRSALLEWIQGGGVMLLTLGRSAAAAPLGAGFDGFVPGVVRFLDSPVDAPDPSKCAFFGAASPSLANLHVKARAALDKSIEEGAELGCAFSDGAPFLVRRSLGRGALFVLAEPFSLDESDFTLRPAFLTMIDRFAEEARAHGGAARVQVGHDFTFGGSNKVEGVFWPTGGGAAQPMVVFEQGGILRATPSLAGRYELDVDGQRETRVATIPEVEIDFTPRTIADRAHDASLGKNAPKVDISRWVALALLGLVAVEIAARVAMKWRAPKDEAA